MVPIVVVFALLFTSSFANPTCVGLDCVSCSNTTGCGWCVQSGVCNVSSSTACDDMCWGRGCAEAVCDACSLSIYPCSQTTVGSLLLLIFYGALLMFGASLMSDGAEGLLDLFPSYGSVIGSLLLPICGALPDSAMIIVSGAFGTVMEAQEQLNVGVGTLAGSTIMLLTVPWTASMFVAACDLNDLGEAVEKKRTRWTLSRTGITVDEETRFNARLMLVSSLAFFVVQGIAFAHLVVDTSDFTEVAKIEHPFALAGFIICTVLLLAYCIYQMAVPTLTKRRQELLQKAREERNAKLRALYVLQHFPAIRDILTAESPLDRVQANALHFARQWKHMSQHTGVPVNNQDDPNAADGSSVLGSINAGGGGKDKEAEPLLLADSVARAAEAELERVEDNASDDDEDGDGEDDGEEDPREHFGKNFAKSIFQLIAGTALVAVFSDPMVDVISEIGHLWGIGAFYVSFVLTPFCSNASELIASLAFASKKKIANTSMTYSQLYGAAIMNNTMGLGIFYGLIAFRGLTWTFTSETMAILLVVWLVGIPAAIKTNFKLYWIFLNAPLYILALVFVYVLDNYAGLQ